MSWREQAPCVGSTSIFYEDVYGPECGNGEPDPEGLAFAVAICGSCPVRRECGVDVLETERGLSPDERFGIAAGLTPEQRYSLDARGTLRHSCGHVRDPLALAAGCLVCPACGIDRAVPPIPLDGDRWRKRHTTLARKVVAWMVPNVPLEGLLPPPTTLAVEMKCRVQDMVRVYEALSADGILDPGNGRRPKYRRATKTGVRKDWTPIHLRGAPE